MPNHEPTPEQLQLQEALMDLPENGLLVSNLCTGNCNWVDASNPYLGPGYVNLRRSVPDPETGKYTCTVPIPWFLNNYELADSPEIPRQAASEGPLFGVTGTGYGLMTEAQAIRAAKEHAAKTGKAEVYKKVATFTATTAVEETWH